MFSAVSIHHKRSGARWLPANVECPSCPIILPDFVNWSQRIWSGIVETAMCKCWEIAVLNISPPFKGNASHGVNFMKKLHV